MANRIAPLAPVIDPADASVVERRAVVVPAAVFAADGTTDALYVGAMGVLRVTQVCSARSGTTPTCDTTVMTSPDGVTFYSAGTFAQLTATGSQRKTFVVDRWVRFDIDVGGTTPSFTLAFDGEAVGG